MSLTVQQCMDGVSEISHRNNLLGKEGLIGRPWGSSWMEGKAEEACLGRRGQEALEVCRVGASPQ